MQPSLSKLLVQIVTVLMVTGAVTGIVFHPFMFIIAATAIVLVVWMFSHIDAGIKSQTRPVQTEYPKRRNKCC